MPEAQLLSRMQRAPRAGGHREARGRLVETRRCVDGPGSEFSLADVHAVAPEFAEGLPSHRHIREKLRQQLRRPRDAGVIASLGKGRYRRLDV
ncbi:MAG: hypothetical protein N3D18_03160 [Roseococcus sp.]|nr:hypothetical protein [Roseococcus sp.]